MCKAEHSISNEFSEVPWLGTFTLMNDSMLDEAKGGFSHVLPSCTLQEFEHFHSFYSKFMTHVREFFLPPERHRFGLVSERSILSSLGVRDSDAWFVIHYIDGCPSCLKVLKDEDDLKHALRADHYFVKEVNMTLLTFIYLCISSISSSCVCHFCFKVVCKTYGFSHFYECIYSLFHFL